MSMNNKNNNNSQQRKKMLKSNRATGAGAGGGREDIEKITTTTTTINQGKKDASSKVIRLAVCLLVFIGGIVSGLIYSSQKSTLSLENYTKIYSNINKKNLHHTVITTASCSTASKCEEIDCMSFENIVRPKQLNHQLSDDELFWKASMLPSIQAYPYKRVPKVAFMFLTRGPLPLLRLWERFFSGHHPLFSIYVHTQVGFTLDVSPLSVFFGRQIPNKEVSWGDVSLADAEKRLLANALLDFSNERFVLLSESCIPVYNFQTVYKYLMESTLSFVESYDDPSRFGRGRYDRHMSPMIEVYHWRKGAQWFEMTRKLAIDIVSDYKYYDLYRKYCHPPCFPDEHYIPTYLNMYHASLNSNRTVTWVDWSLGGPHPTTYVKENITENFIQSIRYYWKKCLYNSETTMQCYLFARKFDPSALEPLLVLSSKIMGF